MPKLPSEAVVQGGVLSAVRAGRGEGEKASCCLRHHIGGVRQLVGGTGGCLCHLQIGPEDRKIPC